MNHPEDLLADYVDGSLGDVARASVDAHLAECVRCRDEVGSAGAARAALRRLPQLEAPAGVAAKALREAAAGSRAAEGPPRYARLLPIAAAAVLVGLLAIALPRLGQNDSNPTTDVAAGAESATDSAPSSAGDTRDLARFANRGATLNKLQLDYNEESVRALLDSTAAQWRGVAFPSVAFDAVGAPAASNAMSAADTQAARCVFGGVPEEQPSIIVQLIEATYQGEPVYVAVVLEGTDPGKPADRAVVWIVRKDDCSLARLAVARI